MPQCNCPDSETSCMDCTVMYTPRAGLEGLREKNQKFNEKSNADLVQLMK
jgi:hypothetical protein